MTPPDDVVTDGSRIHQGGWPALDEPVDTPCLVADRRVIEANIHRMQAVLDGRGVSLRPHVKTHKSVALARAQLEAGAAGITVGTLGEAEVFADAGIRDIFLAYPLWASEAKIPRLRRLVEHVDIKVGVDNAEGAAVLGAAVRGMDGRLPVLVEIDSGEHRSGVDAGAAGAVAQAADRAGLDVRGVFTHGGHSYAAPGAAEGAATDEVVGLEVALESLRSAGFEPSVVSAGSTPTAGMSAQGVVTEERPGTYVFGDRQQLELGSCRVDQAGLFVVATVVSEAADRLVLDSGAKALSKDRKDWLEGFGLIVDYPWLVIADLYDYHAVVRCPVDAGRPRLGDQVLVLPNHACPVANLFPHIEVLQDGTVVDRWTVDAGARSS